jgi:hypothetical protein
VFILHTSAKIEQQDCGKEDIWSWILNKEINTNNLPPYAYPFKKCWGGIFECGRSIKWGDNPIKFTHFYFSASLLEISECWHLQLLLWNKHCGFDLQQPRSNNMFCSQTSQLYPSFSVSGYQTRGLTNSFKDTWRWTKQGSNFYWTGQKGIILSPSQYCNY